MRQNALQYGNSRRNFNLKSGSSAQASNQNSRTSRPRSSHYKEPSNIPGANRVRKQASTNSISHSHSEKVFFPGDNQNRAGSNTKAQRPQTAKVGGAHHQLNKYRSHHEINQANGVPYSEFQSLQPHNSTSNIAYASGQQKPAFITSGTPRGQTKAQLAEQVAQLVTQSSSAGFAQNAQSSTIERKEQRIIAASSAINHTQMNGQAQKRPQTAKYKPYTQSLVKPPALNRPNSGIKGVPPKKKNDPVSRYQSIQNEWSKNNFLKKTTGGNGRKLELDRFNQWRKLADDENKRV